MNIINSEQRVRCHAIIHSASLSVGAVGAGLAQLPCSDNAVIASIQLFMTIALGRVFGIEWNDTAATVTEKLGWLIVKDFAREAADRIAYQHQ